MVYHFGFVSYELGGVYFILSVSKGRLKLYYFRNEETSAGLSVIGKKTPLQDFCWDEFENSCYSKNKKYPQMSFVFFGVNNSIKRKECPIIEPQVKECDEDIELLFLLTT